MVMIQDMAMNAILDRGIEEDDSMARQDRSSPASKLAGRQSYTYAAMQQLQGGLLTMGMMKQSRLAEGKLTNSNDQATGTHMHLGMCT